MIIYIYMQIERERKNIYIHVYIYIHAHIHICTRLDGSFEGTHEIPQVNLRSLSTLDSKWNQFMSASPAFGPLNSKPRGPHAPVLSTPAGHSQP